MLHSVLRQQCVAQLLLTNLAADSPTGCKSQGATQIFFAVPPDIWVGGVNALQPNERASNCPGMQRIT